MKQFHAPGDEKRSLVVVPADRREEWLTGVDPRDFLRDLPADEFKSRPDPLPSRIKKAEAAATTPDLFTKGASG